MNKVRSDYEYKITMMQNRITELEREVDESRESHKQSRSTDQSRVRDLESQIRQHRDVRD